MNIKLGHASIIDEKISSFVRAIVEIFNFYFGCVTYGPPCIELTILIVGALTVIELIVSLSTVSLPRQISRHVSSTILNHVYLYKVTRNCLESVESLNQLSFSTSFKLLSV